jgi:hypothetical protein
MYYEKLYIYEETCKNNELSDKYTLSYKRIFETMVQQEHAGENRALFTATLNSTQ